MNLAWCFLTSAVMSWTVSSSLAEYSAMNSPTSSFTIFSNRVYSSQYSYAGGSAAASAAANFERHAGTCARGSASSEGPAPNDYEEFAE